MPNCEIFQNLPHDEPTLRLVDSAESHIEEWNCTVTEHAFLSHKALIVPVEHNNQDAILKISKDGIDLSASSKLLQFYDGIGAVRLFACDSGAQLMERAVPPVGQLSLDEMVDKGRDDEATHILAHAVKNAISINYSSFDAKLAPPFVYRSESVRKRLAEHIHPELTKFFEQALDIHAELGVEKHLPINCDLHHLNMLDSARGWLVFDPDAVMAPPVMAVANIAANPYRPEFVTGKARVDSFLSIMSDITNLDVKSLAKGAFLNAAQVVSRRIAGPEPTTAGGSIFYMNVAKAVASHAGIKTYLPD